MMHEGKSLRGLGGAIALSPEVGGGGGEKPSSELKSSTEVLRRVEKRTDKLFWTEAFEINKKEARDQFAQVVEKAEEDKSFIVTYHGKPQAAIIGVDKYRVLDYLEAIGVAEKLEQLSARNVSRDEFREGLKHICEEDL